ncbi:MAG TPA: hypothetical protein VJ440_10875 [Candidatus Brocadiaceae bacterium]|nr:hypothetical protein [Candidatus Brocadiaceae bacterium]
MRKRFGIGSDPTAVPLHMVSIGKTNFLKTPGATACQTCFPESDRKD